MIPAAWFAAISALHSSVHALTVFADDSDDVIFGKDHPHLQMPGAWIEIVEIMPMPDVVANANSLCRSSADTYERGWQFRFGSDANVMM